MSIKVVGIDIAKNLFQVCVLSTNGQILSNRKVKRDKLLDTVRQLPEQTVLAMESCAAYFHPSRSPNNIHRDRLIPFMEITNYHR